MNEFENKIEAMKQHIGSLIKIVNELEDMKASSSDAIDETEGFVRDVLHFIEFENIGQGVYQSLGKQIKESRVERRIAVDNIGAINTLFSDSCIKEHEIEVLKKLHKKLISFKAPYQRERKYNYKYLEIEEAS